MSLETQHGSKDVHLLAITADALAKILLHQDLEGRCLCQRFFLLQFASQSLHTSLLLDALHSTERQTKQSSAQHSNITVHLKLGLLVGVHSCTKLN